jgi:hypothetical protein
MGLHGRCLPKRVLVDGKTMNTDDIIKQMPKQTYDSGSNHDHLNRIHVNEGYKLDEVRNHKLLSVDCVRTPCSRRFILLSYVVSVIYSHSI